MKALGFSRISLACGLVLGITVLWVGVAPAMVGGNSLMGGWGPVSGCIECIGTFSHSPETDCDKAEYEGENMNCIDGTATICMDEESTGKWCSADDNIPCSAGPGSHPLCLVTHDAKCE